LVPVFCVSAGLISGPSMASEHRMTKCKCFTARLRKQWKSFKKTDFHKSVAKAQRPLRDAAAKGVLKFVSKSVYWILVIAVVLLVWQVAPWAAMLYAAAMGMPGLQQ
jgi:hypothetical protein